MAEIPKDSEHEKTLLATIEHDPDESDQRILAQKSILHMQNYILQQINKVEIDDLSNSEKLSLQASIDQIQKQYIELIALENPVIKTVWQKANQSGEPSKPSKELQERLQKVEEDVLAYERSLHKKYDSDALAENEPEAPREPVKKTFADFSNNGNIANITTPKMQAHLEEKEAQHNALLRVRKAIASHLDEDGLKALNEAIAKEMEL